jgi:hypothetical protein
MYKLAALSEDGWVDSPMKQLDILFSHWIVADRSQSYLFPERVHSLPYIIQNNNNNVASTITAMQESLTAYLGAYFPTVNVEISHRNEASQDSKVELNIYVQVRTDDQKEFVLGKLLEYSDTVIKRVLDINNA